MSTIALQMKERSESGKGAARALRREGFIPAVLYGGEGESVSLAVETRVLSKMIQSKSFFTSICDLEFGDKKVKAMARDLQLHPVTDQPEHIDFLRVDENTEITVSVPVKFINQEASPGLKRGALLNIVRHELEMVCKINDIPETLTADVSGLNVGDSVHFSHIDVPANVRSVIDDRDFTIATIAAPSALRGKLAEERATEGEEEEESEA